MLPKYNIQQTEKGTIHMGLYSGFQFLDLCLERNRVIK